MLKRIKKDAWILTICLSAVAALVLGMLIPRWQQQAQEYQRLKFGTPRIAVTYDTDKADEVLEHINNGRVTAGLEKLQVDNGALAKAAAIRAKEITVHFAHERPEGQTWQTVFSQCNVKGNLRGENLASGQPTAAAVYNSWWNSESHKANMMNPDYTYTAVVCIEYENSCYWVQLFR